MSYKTFKNLCGNDSISMATTSNHKFFPINNSVYTTIPKKKNIKRRHPYFLFGYVPKKCNCSGKYNRCNSCY